MSRDVEAISLTARPSAARRILFAPSHAASLKEMLFLADRLRAQRGYECHFVINWSCSLPQLDAIQQRGHQLACEIKPPPSAGPVRDGRDPTAGPQRPNWGQGFRRGCGLATVSAFYKSGRRYRKAIRQAERLLEQSRPDLIVVPSDRLVGLETALIVRGKARGVRSMVIPWAVSSPEGPLLVRARDPDGESKYGMRRWINRWVARRFPQYAWRGDGSAVLFLPGEEALAARWLGIMPPAPWGLAGGGGLADRVAIEGNRVFQQAVELGMNAEQLVITGRASTDVLFEANCRSRKHRAEWRNRFRLPSDCRLLVCAVPQLAEHKLLSWKDHWTEIEFLFRSLAAVPDSHLILSLHPKSNPVDYREMAARFGAVIASEPIEQLIPLADLFVSTISSTLVMAIGCHVPALILDLYGMGYQLFADCPGTVTVRSRDEFHAVLRRLVSDGEFHQRLAGESQRTAHEWIQLDGKCSRRLMDLADELMQRGAVQESVGGKAA